MSDPSDTPPAVRLTVNITPITRDALEKSARMLGMTRTDTLNRAVQIYGFIQDQPAGTAIVFDNGDGTSTRMIVQHATLEGSPAEIAARQAATTAANRAYTRTLNRYMCTAVAVAVLGFALAGIGHAREGLAVIGLAYVVAVLGWWRSGRTRKRTLDNPDSAKATKETA